MTKLIKHLSGPNSILFFGLVYTILISVALLSPTVSYLPKIDLIIPLDKLIHVSIYLILVFIWLLYFFKRQGFIILNSLVKVSIACFIYGILIEGSQYLFVTSRQADLLDILANSIGLILGASIFWKVKTRIKS